MKKIGIYQDGEEIQIAKVSKKQFKVLSCNQGKGANSLDKFLSKKNLVAGLETSDVMVHELNFPTDNEKAIRKGVRFQAKMSSHLNEESSVQVPIYKEKKVYVYTSSVGKILKLRRRFESANIQMLSCTPNALARFFKIYAKGYDSAIVIHFAKYTISCVLVQNHIPIQFYLIDRGIESLLEDDIIDLEALRNDPRVMFLKKEITKVFLSFLSKQEKVPVLLTGYVDHFKNIDTALFVEVQEKISSFIDVGLDVRKIHAIPIGLAIDALIDDAYSLQFFQNKALPDYLAKSYGWKVCRVFSGCVLLNLMFFGFVYQKLHTYKKHLTERIDKVIAFDEAILKREYDLSDRLDEKVHTLQQIMLKESGRFVFPLQEANVSKVLYWFYSHPLKHKMNMESIRYQLESYPSIETPKDPYLIKVSIKLRFENTKAENNFYDALTKDPFIDQTRTVEWRKTNQYIQTSFYIKS